MTRRPPSRRELLTGLAAGISLALTRRAVRGTARADTRTASAPPRYWLQIVPAGGVDAIWTTDPRSAREIKTGVDLPYASSGMVESGGVRLGPAFARLAPRAGSFAVVNGILVKAANHYTGFEQVTRLRTNTTPRTPSCLDILGEHRDSQAVGHVILNPSLREARTLGALVDPVARELGGAGPKAEDGLFGALDRLTQEQLGDLVKVTTTRIDSLKRGGAPDYQRRAALDALGQTRALFEKLGTVPRFSPTPWLEPAEEANLAMPPLLQRALWLIENDLAATVTVFSPPGRWDTHHHNIEQLELGELLAANLVRLIENLNRRSNRHGKLSELTAVVVGSEIGRFPYMNVLAGKDHFPQVPYLFAGPAFRAGRAYGAIGKEMEALPMSLETGAADARGDRMFLDDVGHTALRIGGIDPVHYGVGGRELRFLRTA